VREGVYPLLLVGVLGPPPKNFENKDTKSCILAVFLCKISDTKSSSKMTFYTSKNKDKLSVQKS
jgi:hypothetical protein